MNSSPTRVAFFAPYTEHVGTEGVMLKLSSYFKENGVSTDLLRTYREWPAGRRIEGRIVELNAQWSSTVIDTLPFPWKKFFMAGVILPRLVWYLRREQPDILITGLLPSVAVVARELSGADVKIIATIQGLPQPDRLRSWVWPTLFSRVDRVVAPVSSIAERTAAIADLSSDTIEIIPNPVITDELVNAGAEEPDHPWFSDDTPIIVAVGRQTRQKDFSTLLRAFDVLQETYDVRLIIPGKTDERTDELHALRAELGLQDFVDFPGFVENPYAYMASADVFVLSSAWEGPGHVLIEALALGTPVVSTDCPSGPREILNDGEAGILVPVGDPQRMASGIARLIEDDTLRDRYRDAGKHAVDGFHRDSAGKNYLELCNRLIESPNHAH